MSPRGIAQHDTHHERGIAAQCLVIDQVEFKNGCQPCSTIRRDGQFYVPAMVTDVGVRAQRDPQTIQRDVTDKPLLNPGRDGSALDARNADTATLPMHVRLTGKRRGLTQPWASEVLDKMDPAVGIRDQLDGLIAKGRRGRVEHETRHLAGDALGIAQVVLHAHPHPQLFGWLICVDL